LGVQHIHNLNIIHRDLRLNNIIFNNNTNKNIKIIDIAFGGLAINIVSDNIGSIDYMPPEILIDKN